MAYKKKSDRVRYWRKWYRLNRVRHISAQMKFKKLALQEIRKAKARPCSDCNIQYHYFVMEFDHVYGEKEFNISHASNRHCLSKILREIKKCEVVCANCHKYRTWARTNKEVLMSEDVAVYEANKKELTPENVEKGIQNHKENPIFAVAGSILPKDFPDLLKMAAVMAKSGLVPDGLRNNTEAVAVVILHGLELGITPTMAVQNIMVVNGRPAAWGDLVKALVLGSKKCKMFDEDNASVALKQGRGRCHLVRDNGMEVEVEFSIEDAKRAQLWDNPKKDPWIKYPGRMLQMRARSWACRDLFPDVLKGMQIREEIDDIEIISPGVTAMPKAKAPAAHQVVDAVPVESAEPINDAQAPGDAPGDIISPEEAQTFFKLRIDCKVPIADATKWVRENGFNSVTELTHAKAEEFRQWLEARRPA